MFEAVVLVTTPIAVCIVRSNIKFPIFHCSGHVVSSEYMKDWEQCRQNHLKCPRCSKTLRGSNVSQIIFNSAYFLLAVLVEGDESSRLRHCAKKVIFTACHLGKLKLTFTSPNIISTSPKSILISRLIS